MYPNLLFIPMLFAAAFLFWAGLFVCGKLESLKGRIRLFFLTLALAAPAFIFSFYYLQFFCEPLWLYRFRAVPYSELTASLAGFPAGILQAVLIREKVIASRKIIPVFLCFWLMVPYVKPILAPIPEDQFQGQWKDGVCMQGASPTCGPAAAATVLRILGKHATEKELAQECHSSLSGTENWYLARALRKRGCEIEYLVLERKLEPLPCPAIAGIITPAGLGHFIAFMEEKKDHYVIGDSTKGRLVVPKGQVHVRFDFTGFFMTVRRVQTGAAGRT